MADVFVSYKSEEAPRVEPLVLGLEAAGLSVWWDAEIRAAEEWRQEIETELKAARCVIVVWTRLSVGSKFVRDEASRASAAGKLLQIRLDDVELPLGFGEDQVVDLDGWRGGQKDVRLRHAVGCAKAMVRGNAMPRRPQRFRKPIAWASVAAGAVLLLLLLANLPGLREVACSLPGAAIVCGEPKPVISRQPRVFRTRPRLEPFATEAEARGAAMESVAAEVADACDVYSRDAFRLDSAELGEYEFECSELGRGYRCVIEGQAECVYEQIGE